MSNPLTGKNVVVTGELPDLTDRVELFARNLKVEEEGINITGVSIDDLSVDNAGDVVLAPDSFNRGTTQGLRGVAEHIREKVNGNIPVVVMLLRSDIAIVRGNAPGIIGVSSVNSLPEAVRMAIGL